MTGADRMTLGCQRRYTMPRTTTFAEFPPAFAAAADFCAHMELHSSFQAMPPPRNLRGPIKRRHRAALSRFNTAVIDQHFVITGEGAGGSLLRWWNVKVI